MGGGGGEGRGGELGERRRGVGGGRGGELGERRRGVGGEEEEAKD